MINKQGIWLLTLFSLILVLSVYYITMPSELLTTNSKNIKKNKSEEKVTVTNSDVLTVLQVEKDEERASLAAEYNEILSNKKSTTEEKNNAYEGLKKIDEIKAKEEAIQEKIKKNFKVDVFVKIDGNNVSVTINSKDHNYSSANKIMRSIQEEYKEKMYISIKYQN